jgi:hypothetical protein
VHRLALYALQYQQRQGTLQVIATRTDHFGSPIDFYGRMRLYGSLVKDEIGKRWGKSFSAAKPQPLRINSLLSVMGRRILLKQYRNLFTRLLF